MIHKVRMKDKHKIQKRYVDNSCGFSVTLMNVPMIQVRGTWVPNIDYNKLQIELAVVLSQKQNRLTGNEIKFIRLFFEMNLTEFAQRFSVKHTAVLKWERSKDNFTKMNWSTEKDIRLFIASKLEVKIIEVDVKKSLEFSELYQKLEEEKPEKQCPIELDAEKLAA